MDGWKEGRKGGEREGMKDGWKDGFGFSASWLLTFVAFGFLAFCLSGFFALCCNCCEDTEYHEYHIKQTGQKDNNNVSKKAESNNRNLQEIFENIQ